MHVAKTIPLCMEMTSFTLLIHDPHSNTGNRSTTAPEIGSKEIQAALNLHEQVIRLQGRRADDAASIHVDSRTTVSETTYEGIKKEFL